jgi:glycosyltransferase involved in cell wall biosynthesis
MRVLVATDHVGFRTGLSAEYHRIGFEVQLGTAALFQRDQCFDIIHCHWPEELCDWRTPPDPGQAQRIIDALDWWRGRAQLVCSVHNLLPHAVTPDDTETLAYYRAFYERMHHIGHFSETSRDRVVEAFPESAGKRHFVHGLNLFDDVKALSPGRAAARKALGLGPEDFAVLAFGQLRTGDEMALIRRGLEQVKKVSPVVLFCARPTWPYRPLTRALARFRHALWCLRHARRWLRGYVDDRLTAILFEAADALIIPRFGRHLNSGLLPLAMTFGTPMAAPDYGIYREYLSSSENELYRPADAAALGRAIERLSNRSGEQVRASNLALAADWGWRSIVERIVERVGEAAGPGAKRVVG